MSATILIVDDEENARHMLSAYLAQKGYEVLNASTLAEARQEIASARADIVLLDVKLPDGYGPALLEETAHLPNRPAIILITAFGEIEMAVEAMKNGAHDFLQKPIQFERLHKSILRAQEIVAMRRELAHLRQAQRKKLGGMVFKNAAMKQLLHQAQRAAAASVSVLITGETGTGKEILARAIHQLGPRANKPFIAINCAAIQSTVLESELFGYEAGAFTGAEKRKSGLMEVADGGILFLDEISSMPLDMQAKLLRALAERKFRRVGGTREIQVDVQVLAASNRDLPAMIQDGRFREDLYYRLKVVDLHIPPLRERKDEIPDLVGLFIRENNPRMGLNIEGVTPAGMRALLEHRWPGNIRELRNVIERAMLSCDAPLIALPHLPPELAHPATPMQNAVQ
ncbi:MAG TPA: sigma-54-dependent Fis family transcriptional regulator [Chloroflexi bacterium]|nr:sigma-54-dependent Fis family transcriptional regulator [Chloroflexota bacterium]